MSNNTSSYLVKLFKFDNAKQSYEEREDCKLTLSDSGKMTVMGTDSNYIYIDVDVNEDDVYGTSKKNYKQCTFDLEMYCNGIPFGVQFDANSASASTDFVTNLDKIRKKKYSIEYYRSGNKRLEGLQVDGQFIGSCIEYYDRDDSPIKYIGDFEDGLYDGEGEFFSVNGELCLTCNNICSGKPNGKGKLVVGQNKQIETIEMKEYKDLKSTDDNFTDQIYSRINPEHETVLELVRFERMDTDNKLMYLFDELQKLKVSGKKPERRSIFNLL